MYYGLQNLSPRPSSWSLVTMHTNLPAIYQVAIVNYLDSEMEKSSINMITFQSYGWCALANGAIVKFIKCSVAGLLAFLFCLSGTRLCGC